LFSVGFQGGEVFTVFPEFDENIANLVRSALVAPFVGGSVGLEVIADFLDPVSHIRKPRRYQGPEFAAVMVGWVGRLRLLLAPTEQFFALLENPDNSPSR
jgi:hypothetical protein